MVNYPTASYRTIASALTPQAVSEYLAFSRLGARTQGKY